ncbi:PAS domain S-box protein [Tamlana sp. 62-3]|uniref:histidine kinase n=1 Tax=Neotamlana sargassicola TaxID=2883125 RepID=A0A9X1L858_9FLAO|nr:PAS domain-containing sensor histidine kinase [Tamlana sargassicola]MCB4809541.1 PAS domain S-box protein [Tamlana sargassicola]
MQSSKNVLSMNEKEFYLDFIQSTAKIGFWEVFLDSNTVIWSPETYKIHELPLSYKPSVKEGINFYKEGYSRDTISKAFKNCVEKHESYDVELQIITASGKEKWVRAIGKAQVNNGICFKVSGVFQDIDEKTKITTELARREQLLTKTFELSAVGTVTLDLKGKFLDANRSFCETFGYTKNELLALSFLDITHPNDKNKGKQAIMDMMNGKVNYFQTEKRYLGKNGRTIWAFISSTLIRDNNGQPLHFVTQINDISQIKRSTKKIVNLLDTTENQNKRLLNFAHIVSHNLRSHFSNLNMLLDLAKMEIPESTENEIYPLLKQAVDHLGETVDNLNEVASINTKKDIKLEPISLLPTINNIANSIAAQIIATNAKLSINVDDNITVMAIPAYLDSIILNFLTNAIKYKKPNDNPVIDINAEIKNNFVILKIRDYGMGIDLQKYGEKLFGMYKTFHKHKDSRGIGLFITKNQIEAIGGQVQVESEVNLGTTFIVKLKNYEKN